MIATRPTEWQLETTRVERGELVWVGVKEGDRVATGQGNALGSTGAAIINKFFVTEVTWWSVLLAFGVSAAVGIILGVAPAIRASRLDPIDALRYE